MSRFVRRCVTALGVGGVVLASAVVGTGSAPASSPSATPSAAATTGWLCRVPHGYTYDQVRESLQCDPDGLSYSYHVVKPRDGLFACRVPRGFTYDMVRKNLQCDPNGLSTMYRLRKK